MDERTERNSQRKWSRQRIRCTGSFFSKNANRWSWSSGGRSRSAGPGYNLLAPEVLDPRKAGRIDSVGAGATVDLDNIANAHRRATISGYVARRSIFVQRNKRAPRNDRCLPARNQKQVLRSRLCTPAPAGHLAGTREGNRCADQRYPSPC